MTKWSSDIFKEKIKKFNLNLCFPDYNGGFNDSAALDFIQNRYLEVDKNKHRKLFMHVTCATDTKNIQVVFDAVKNIILTKYLKEYNLI